MVITCLDVRIIYFISCDCIMNFHHPIHYVKNCWVRLLSNYHIMYICTIYKRLDTCLMSISIFSLWDKVTLLLLKLHFFGADVVEWCRALDIKLSDWCYSVSMVWAQIPSREEQNVIAQKSNSNTVCLIFRRIYNIYYLHSITSNFEIQWDRCSVWLSPT